MDDSASLEVYKQINAVLDKASDFALFVCEALISMLPALRLFIITWKRGILISRHPHWRWLIIRLPDWIIYRWPVEFETENNADD